MGAGRRETASGGKCLENSAESVIISDASGQIVSVNKAFTTMTGYSPDQVVGRSPEFLRSDEHDAAFYTQLWIR